MTAVLVRGDDPDSSRGEAIPPDPPGIPPRTTPPSKPKLAVWKLASCDGCQLTLLDCEDELRDARRIVEIRAASALTDQLRRLGMTEAEVDRVFATFNAASPALASSGDR